MKVRIRFSKLGKIRFTGHRDVARIWERTVRKAGTQVAYSAGFSPRPKLSFGLALPTGAESVAEYLDIELVDSVDLDELVRRWGEALPTGFEILAIEELIGSVASLQEQVVASDWRISLRGIDRAAADAVVERVLASASLPLERERKGERRVDDVRPAIERLAVGGADGVVTLEVTLSTVGRALRPGELLSVCFPDGPDEADLVAAMVRTHQWIERDGVRRELPPLPDTTRVHAASVVCA